MGSVLEGGLPTGATGAASSTRFRLDTNGSPKTEHEQQRVAGLCNFSPVEGSLGAVVKLLPCDHEVMGSSPGNSLLQKCRERLRTIDPKWSDPSLDPAQAGATCTRDKEL
ncbi:hypothetical protein VPH35_128938 [Triticum aestivum]